MLGNLSGWHLLILLAVILLLFGAPKLPGLARSLGQSMRIFRSEVRTMKSESDADAPAAPASAAPASAAPAAPSAPAPSGEAAAPARDTDTPTS